MQCTSFLISVLLEPQECSPNLHAKCVVQITVCNIAYTKLYSLKIVLVNDCTQNSLCIFLYKIFCMYNIIHYTYLYKKLILLL